MIFLSILTKSLALALVHLHPWLALASWLAGGAADLVLVRRAGGAKRGWMAAAGRVALLHLAALVIGWAAAGACDYAAMRWKDGIPLFAWMVEGLLRLTGMAAGSRDGLVYLTTMAGPLEFAASIDGMGLKLPILFFVLSATWLLWAQTPLGETARKLGVIAGILLGVALVRTAGVVLLADSLFGFVGYESEELPYRPFMDEAAAVWSYLPVLLGAGVLLAHWLPAPAAFPMDTPAGARAPLPRWLPWLAGPVVLVLGGMVFWEARGTPKTGKVVFSSHHAQWSRSDRPYDREWYGADSGYNYACVKRLFGKFYQVADAAGPLGKADLEGASTLVIYDPDRRFSKDEIELVRDFVRGGGGLLVIGDHTNVFGSTSHLNELCEPFGFQFRDDVLFDLDEDFHQVIDAPLLGSVFWHGIDFFKLRGPASIRPTSMWTRSVFEVGHSKSVRAIYSVNNFYPPPHDDPKMKSGTFCVASASRYGSGRVAAWGDSTVFSNFEIFYPGKYEYLLNTMHWLNHKDSMLVAVGRRMAPLILLAGVAVVLVRRREPRLWLVTGLVVVTTLGAARLAAKWVENRGAGFPAPIQPSEWVTFHASAQDPGHHLRGFTAEGPYDQRYEVFIQWVLRGGAFAGFHAPGGGAGDRLYDHLRASGMARNARALIVRKVEDLAQVDELGALVAGTTDPILLMFATTISAEQAAASLQSAGIITSAGGLAQVAEAWPAGEALVDAEGRRLVVVAGADRFSDQAMGISEKVVPDDAQRVLFQSSFRLIDRLFGRETPAPN